MKKIAIRPRWTTKPAKALTPTAVTPAAGSTPDFCRKRAFRPMPPTFAGEIRLMNDEANCAVSRGQNDSRIATAPASEIALATYVSTEAARTAGIQAQFAFSTACQLPLALASSGSRI